MQRVQALLENEPFDGNALSVARRTELAQAGFLVMREVANLPARRWIEFDLVMQPAGVAAATFDPGRNFSERA